MSNPFSIIVASVTASSADDSTGAVDAEIVFILDGTPSRGSVTLYPDHGRSTVAGRHPLGTCGTPRYGWADDAVNAAITIAEDADEDWDASDFVSEVVGYVDASAIAAGV